MEAIDSVPESSNKGARRMQRALDGFTAARTVLANTPSASTLLVYVEALQRLRETIDAEVAWDMDAARKDLES